MPKVEMPNMSGKTIGKGQFKLLSPIGRGSFGTVYNALDMSTKPPTLRAVKVVRKLTQRANNQLREIVFHNGVSDHENVVTFYHAFQDARYLYIVLDFCPGGDMWGAIAAGEYWKNDELCRKVFLKLIDALEHCHRKGIYHRDLKPNNILVGEEAWEVYLSDFGLASPGKISQSFGVGTTQFRSPECNNSGGAYKTFDAERNDIWALVSSSPLYSEGVCPGTRHRKTTSTTFVTCVILITFAKCSLYHARRTSYCNVFSTHAPSTPPVSMTLG
ncbi:kinase-like domain-containing protein [Irpex lacteus]|nr:kinase-like domain-containing protein [Irpex lacteus]